MSTKKKVLDFSDFPDQPQAQSQDRQADLSGFPDQPASQSKVPQGPPDPQNIAEVAQRTLQNIQQPGVENPQTFLGKTVKTMGDIASYPLGLPGSFKNIKERVGSGSPADAYFELMPQMEKGSAIVKQAKSGAIGNILRDEGTQPLQIPGTDKSIPSVPYKYIPGLRGFKQTQQEYPNLAGAQAFGVDMGLDLAPFEPSTYAMMMLPTALRAAGESSLSYRPFVQSPSVIEKGLGKVAQDLGAPGVKPSEVGQAVQDSYQRSTGGPLAIHTAPMPEFPKPDLPPEPALPQGKDLFMPEYQKVAGQFKGEPVQTSQVGEEIQGQYNKNVDALKKKEGDLWNSVSEEHFDKPADLSNTRAHLEGVFQSQNNGEQSYLERLNPNLQEIARKQPNPEEFAKNILEASKSSKQPSLMMAGEQSATPEPIPQIGKNQGVLQKVYEAANNPDINFGQAKTLRSQLGGMIKWGVRGDSYNHTLKGAYNALTEDMNAAAEKGGFGKEIGAAKQATKDFFAYTEKPSSEIISKADYPSDLPKQLIKSESPERVKELFTEHGLSADQKNLVRRGVLDRLANKSGGDPKKFADALNGYSPETRKALFGDQFDVVESLKEVAPRLKDEIDKIKSTHEKTIFDIRNTYKEGMDAVKAGAKTKSSILSRDELALNKVMENTKASELVDEVVKDGSPETADLLTKSIDHDSMDLLRRGVINKMIEGKSFKSLSPEFIDKFFGKDAKTVQALKDTHEFYSQKMEEYSGRGYKPFQLRFKEYFLNLFRKYRLTSKVKDFMEASGGKEMANKAFPDRSFPLTNQLRQRDIQPAIALPYEISQQNK